MQPTTADDDPVSRPGNSPEETAEEETVEEEIVEEEMVEEVDTRGNTIRVVPRRVMREGRLWHRSVFVAVVSHDGDLLVHRRADHKDVWPGWWDVAIGGVCVPGESWGDAAAREAREEIGVEGAVMELLGTGAYRDTDVALVGAVYLCRSDGPFRFADGEVTEAHWVRPDDLTEWLCAKTFLPDSVALVLPRLAAVLDSAGSR